MSSEYIDTIRQTLSCKTSAIVDDAVTLRFTGRLTDREDALVEAFTAVADVVERLEDDGYGSSESINDLKNQVEDLEGDITTLQDRVSELEATLKALFDVTQGAIELAEDMGVGEKYISEFTERARRTCPTLNW